MSGQASPRRLVYMALLGGYEQLLEQPVAHDSDADFVCFTDDPELRSDTWRIERIEPALPGDPVRSARILKIRGHELLEDYDETLWIDNTVLLTADPVALLDQWLDGVDLAMPAHSYRGSVAAEFDAVLSGGMDAGARIDEQLAAYSAHHPERLDAPVIWTALLARRWSEETRRTMQVWIDHVLRFSRRDQLSVGYAIAETGQRFAAIELDNHESECHRWPVASGRPERDDMPQRWPIRSEHERLARLHAQIDELTVQFNRSVVERERTIQELMASRSWRITRPLRDAGRLASTLLRSRRRDATDLK